MTEQQSIGTREPAYSHRNLVLWKRGQELAREVITIAARIPATRVSDALVRQAIRAVGSIPASIAEGHGRYSPAAYRNHLSIARGSACEVDSWLDLMKELSLISAHDEARLHRLCSEMIGALTGRMRDLEKVIGARARETPARYEVNDPALADCSDAEMFRGSER